MKRFVLWLCCLSFAAAAPLAARSLPAQEPAAPPDGPSAADPSTADPSVAAPDGELALTQRQIREKFQRLEEVLQRMAELTAANDPQRAALLRKALQQGKDDLILTQMERLVELLDRERLAAAAANQQEVQQDLERMLQLLLSENRGQRLASEMARYKEYLKRVNKLIKDEEALRDQTGRGADADALARRQGDVADKTQGLAEDIRRNEEGDAPQGSAGEPPAGENQPPQDGEGSESQGGTPMPAEGEPQEGEGESPAEPGDDNPPADSESKPTEGEGQPEESQPAEGQPAEGQPSEGQPSQGQPSQGQPSQGQPSEGEGDQQQQQPQEGQESQTPGRQRIEAAEKKMREAQQKLEKAQREAAQEDQEQAVKELEQAKAELEEILRQLREEQIARTLKQLEARFREMLEAQLLVYEGTLRLDKVPDERRDRNHLIEAGRQSRREGEIVAEADKALALLREEASSVAIPEAIEQMREDMLTVVEWLAEGNVGELTQGVEEDVIAALEEMIDALEKAQRDQERQQQQPPQQPQQPQDQPLVDKLAELKMIRALQMRVNKRTERYSKLIDGEQAADPDLLRALDQLSDREERVRKATRDIAVGRNE